MQGVLLYVISTEAILLLRIKLWRIT